MSFTIADIKVENFEGTPYAPLQTLVSQFGANVEWNGEVGSMLITSDISDNIRMSQAEVNAMANFSVDEAIRIGEQNGHSFFGMQVAYIDGGYYISHGRVIWEYAALPVGENAIFDDEDSEGVPPKNMYYIQVASDGTITRL